MRRGHSAASPWALSTAQRCALAATTGVLLTLLYPPFGFGVLAWLALAPLLVALDGATTWGGFGLGWLAGAVGSLGVTGLWIYHAAHDYFGLSPLLAAAFTIATTQLFVGCYFGLFGIGVATLGKIRLRFLLVPAFLVTAEYARSHLLSGCPWDLLGHSQTNLRLIQICDVSGVYGLSFLLALSAAAIAERQQRRAAVAVALTAALLALAYGQWRLTTLARGGFPVLSTTLVQANLPNQERGRPEFFSAHLDRYLALTNARTGRAGLIIWPENAVPFFLEENPALLAQITDDLRSQHAVLLTGAPRSDGVGGTAALYNSAYLLDENGVRGSYDKRVLLPFVERLPLRADETPYRRGTIPTLFSAAGAPFGTLICYEAIYPELAGGLVRRGARVLVNISNDSWFEAGAGPEQHYEIARFRAVENRVSLVRVTNSGVSGVIDPLGREIARLPKGAATAQTVAVPIGPAGSFYTRCGDVFAAACIAASLLAIAARVRRFTRPGRTSPRDT